jgi:hypothetical protein
MGWKQFWFEVHRYDLKNNEESYISRGGMGWFWSNVEELGFAPYRFRTTASAQAAVDREARLFDKKRWRVTIVPVIRKKRGDSQLEVLANVLLGAAQSGASLDEVIDLTIKRLKRKRKT